jgi:Hemerythrin HHE cation binding domain
VHAIKLLEEDHARIEDLFERLAKTDGAQDRDWLFERLENELVVHTLAEDNIFLPHVEEAIEDSQEATSEFVEGNRGYLQEAAALVEASYEDHRGIRALLRNLGRLRVVDQEWEGRLEELREAVSRQVEREENLFPRAEKVLEEEDFERIGNLIEHCKGQLRGLAQAKLASSSGLTPDAREAGLDPAWKGGRLVVARTAEGD